MGHFSERFQRVPHEGLLTRRVTPAAAKRSMTSDLDNYRTATVLIREHGDGAALEAAQRADAMLAKGDMEGCAIWKRIVAAAEEIQRMERREDEAAH